MKQTNETAIVRHVDQVVPITVGIGARIFEVSLWLLFIVPGVIFQICKLSAENYFNSLEQKIRHHESQIDNYLEQRVNVLKNCARLLDRAIDLDQTTYERLAQYRSGTELTEEGRKQLAADLNAFSRAISITIESYPNELGAHAAIQEAMRENVYLQREVSSARDLLNDAVYAWNRDIHQWIVKRIVAAEKRYTTKRFFETSYVEPEDTFF